MNIPCLWGWLEMPIPALQSPFRRVKISVGNYFEGWCTSKQVEKVLKVKLKFRGSKSGRPTDDLLWSSGRPTAILGVRTPGRPLNLHAAHWHLSFHKFDIRPCLLRRASGIAHHHTPKMVLRSVIFSTPKSGKKYSMYTIKVHTRGYSTPECLEKCYL